MSANKLKWVTMGRLSLVMIGVGSALLASHAWAGPPAKKKPAAESTSAATGNSHAMPALSFKMKNIDGKDQDLRQYYGKVVLMVNTASKCGFTPQYKGLEALYEKYKKKGLVVLGFPANDFGHQEPGTESEIKEFCSTTYHVQFPMFSKVCVKGDKSCDLYKYLTDTKADHKFGGDIKWNFTKFLVNRKGEVVDRFDTRIAPDDGAVTAAIEKALAEPAPSDAPKHGKSKGKHKN